MLLIILIIIKNSCNVSIIIPPKISPEQPVGREREGERVPQRGAQGERGNLQKPQEDGGWEQGPRTQTQNHRDRKAEGPLG